MDWISFGSGGEYIRGRDKYDMSLGIGITTSAGAKGALSFEDDGYYWHLCPFFEAVAKKTNKHIDLYDIISYEGPELVVVLSELQRAKLEALQKPDYWMVEIGKNGLTGDFIYSLVVRDTLLQKVDAFISAVREASDQGGCIVCIGD